MKNFEMRAVAAIAFWALGLAPLCPSHSVAQEPPSTVPPGVSDQAAFEPPTVEWSRPTDSKRVSDRFTPAPGLPPGELRYRRRWAVVVGVNYDEADCARPGAATATCPSWPRPEGDAEEAAWVLTEKYGYDPDSVRACSIGKQATKSGDREPPREGLFCHHKQVGLRTASCSTFPATGWGPGGGSSRERRTFSPPTPRRTRTRRGRTPPSRSTNGIVDEACATECRARHVLLSWIAATPGRSFRCRPPSGAP